MARVKKAHGGGAVHFNMTPMIDIVFNLIIFFMLVAQFEKLQIEKVNLPVAETAEPKDYSAYRNIVINIINPDDPQVKVLGRVVDSSISMGIPESELTKLLLAKKDEGSEDRPLNVILRADEMIPYEDVARVMLCAGGAEIEGWWITTEREDEQTP